MLMSEHDAPRVEIRKQPIDRITGPLQRFLHVEAASGGFLAGIGFTMALFISDLAPDGKTLDAAKVGILGASALAAVIGMILLLKLLPKPTEN